MQAEALNAVYGATIREQAAKAERHRITDEVRRNRKGQFVSRPASRAGEEITDPEEKARNAFAEKYSQIVGSE